MTFVHGLLLGGGLLVLLIRRQSAHGVCGPDAWRHTSAGTTGGSPRS